MADLFKSGGSLWDAAKSVTNTKTGTSFLKDLGKNTGTIGNILGGISNLFGGGGGAASSNNIFGAILGGLGGAAEGLLSEKAVEKAGEQSRKTISFQAALEDYYNQKSKVRKRAALDTYGQFSTMDRWAPGARPAPAIDVPARPNP